jgi:hypothetical protein
MSRPSLLNLNDDDHLPVQLADGRGHERGGGQMIASNEEMMGAQKWKRRQSADEPQTNGTPQRMHDQETAVVADTERF